jgi:hypothetical protein
VPEEDVAIFANVINHVQRPKFMKAVVDDLLQSQLFGGDYIAMHYRFDDDDFLSRCAKDFSQMCQFIRDMKNDLKTAAKNFVNFLETKRSQGIAIKAVYLAAPPQETEIRSKIRNALKFKYPNEEVKFVDANDVEPFYRRLANIPEGLNGDIMSSIEQEICMRSRIFLAARPSSWSSNVSIQRVGDPAIRKYVADGEFLLDVLAGNV